VPLTIDPPEELLANQESMISPIVINDKMLSHSAVSPLLSSSSSSTANQNAHQLSNGSEAYRSVPNMNAADKKIINDPYISFIDSDAISFLMDLNEQEEVLF
jgi:hypothetical protein